MTDDEQGTSGTLAPAWFRNSPVGSGRSTERLHSLTRLGGRLLSAASPLPLPGALSAAQLTAVADSIAAQRRSIEVLKAQLSSFDEQLKALEQFLGPLAEWSRTWA
jgi:hypothetical protein